MHPTIRGHLQHSLFPRFYDHARLERRERFPARPCKVLTFLLMHRPANMIKCPHCQVEVQPHGLSVHISQWCKAQAMAIANILKKRQEHVQEVAMVELEDRCCRG